MSYRDLRDLDPDPWWRDPSSQVSYPVDPRDVLDGEEHARWRAERSRRRRWRRRGIGLRDATVDRP